MLFKKHSQENDQQRDSEGTFWYSCLLYTELFLRPLISKRNKEVFIRDVVFESKIS